jgi:hypothetical protein
LNFQAHTRGDIGSIADFISKWLQIFQMLISAAGSALSGCLRRSGRYSDSLTLPTPLGKPPTSTTDDANETDASALCSLGRKPVPLHHSFLQCRAVDPDWAIEQNCWADRVNKEFLIAHAIPPSSPIPELRLRTIKY